MIKDILSNSLKNSHNVVMSRSHYFYFKLSVKDLENVVSAYQVEFDTLLEDCFSDEELLSFETLIDAIAAVYVQPILSEMSFDDFYADEIREEDQRNFFHSAKSSICLENLPYFESNPFQVTYLKTLLKKFPEVLIDCGGVNTLMFKDQYLLDLSKFKDIDSLVPLSEAPRPEIKTSKPLDPIDFFIFDVYKEIDRLKLSDKWQSLNFDGQSDNLIKIFKVMSAEKLDSSALLRKTGLNAKTFDDTLERLKFWLKKN